ncbi:MAG: ATP-binding cassette domain-containing protein, partial [Planctomycetota bacterium]
MPTEREPAGDASTLAVRCTGIEKSFKAGETRIRVLRGTDFEAHGGKMNFLVGPSGCGKTTLISVIGAILTCEDGELSVLGRDLRTMRNGQLADFRLNNLGFIFQQFNLLPALNAEENASLPLVARGTSTKHAERRARDLLERLGLEGQTRKVP